MEPHELQQFLQGLNEMAEYFGDAIGKERQKTYLRLWEKTGGTMDEWQYACTQAMLRETFHKVPLVAVLQGYIEEYRHVRERATWAARRQLEASPEFQRAREAKDRESALRQMDADEAFRKERSNGTTA